MFQLKSLLRSGLILACATAAGCARTHATGADDPVATVEEAGDASLVTVARPEQFPLTLVTLRDYRAQLEVTGVVSADVSRTVPVNSMTGGRVVDVRVRLGDTVARDQELLTITSSDVAQARADLRKAQADAVLARQALDRARTLNEHEALAAKDLEVAVNADAKAQADVRAADQRLRMLGASPDGDSPVVAIRAPVAGTIVEQNVTGAAGVKSLDNAPNLFTIADLSNVWVLCDVYENNLDDARVGDTAVVRLNAFPDRPLTATVSNVSRVLDPATRTAKVRLEVGNRAGLLRPGMYAAVVFTSRRVERRAVVPASAVLRLHDRNWVYVRDSGPRFRRLEVRAGRPERDGTQSVLAGLLVGDRVVTNALQLSSVDQ